MDTSPPPEPLLRPEIAKETKQGLLSLRLAIASILLFWVGLFARIKWVGTVIWGFVPDVAMVLGLIAWGLGIRGRRTLYGKIAIVILFVSLIIGIGLMCVG